MSSERDDRRVDILLAEYSAVRVLADQKSSASQATTGAYLTIVATILGFVIANKADVRFLLIVPILSMTFGFTIIARYRDRAIASDYIRTRLQPLIEEYSGDSRLFQWEGYYRSCRNRRRSWYGLGLSLLFPVSSLACLIVAAPKLESTIDWVAWCASATTIVPIVVVSCRELLARLLRNRRICDGITPGQP